MENLETMTINDPEEAVVEEAEQILQVLGGQWGTELGQGMHAAVACASQLDMQGADEELTKLARTYVEAPMRALLAYYAYQIDDDTALASLKESAVRLKESGTSELVRKAGESLSNLFTNEK